MRKFLKIVLVILVFVFTGALLSTSNSLMKWAAFAAVSDFIILSCVWFYQEVYRPVLVRIERKKENVVPPQILSHGRQRRSDGGGSAGTHEGGTPVPRPHSPFSPKPRLTQKKPLFRDDSPTEVNSKTEPIKSEVPVSSGVSSSMRRAS